jgi:Zn-dependent protease with chaperone function
MAALSLPVVALALFVGTAWVAAALLLPAWLRAADALPGAARLAPQVAALPWFAGLALALGALLPGDPHQGSTLLCHCLESMPTWRHLCPVHPEQAGSLALPALAVLGLLLPGRLRAASALLRAPIGWGGGGQPRVVALGRPVALLHGWLRPTLVVDRGLWQVLSGGERAAVLAHEQGHLARRDPQVLMLLRALLVLAPRACAERAARRWLHRAERCADREAARLIGDPVVVADALIRCARLGSAAPPLAVAWTGGDVAQRVQALVEGDPVGAGAPAPRAKPDVGPTDAALLVFLVAAALAATPWVHHPMEHLLNLTR